MNRRQVRHQAGFTLAEMMIVVAIVGILVTLAIVYMRPRVRAIDVATRVGDMVHEAGRRAVALGPLRPDVAQFLNNKARTQILASQPGGVGPVTFSLFRLEENPLPSNNGQWVWVSSYVVDRHVLAFKWADQIGNSAMAGQSAVWDAPAAPSTAGFRMQCRPDGTCDAKTLFFQADLTLGSVPTFEQFAKLAIMPLGGAINTRTDWN